MRAKVVVNAAGVWADEVRALDEGADPDSIRPAKGVHITVPWEKVRNDIAVVIPVPKDKRSLFVVPWGRTARRHVRAHLRRHHRHRLRRPARRSAVHQATTSTTCSRRSTHRSPPAVTEADITGVWAGLRPLVKSAVVGAHRRPVAAPQGQPQQPAA